jgi:hypothetical protein
MIQILASLTIAAAEMPIHQVHRKLFCDTTWWLRYVAHIRNLLAPYRVIYRDVGNWIQGTLLFDEPLYLFAQVAAQFSQRLGNLPGDDTTNLSTLSAVTSAPGSSRP